MTKRLFNFVITTYIFLSLGSAFAIDNPESPKYVDEFLKRADRFESNFQHNASTTLDYISGYKKYENFLDRELNSAYVLLMTRLDIKSKTILRHSQRKWLKYRDEEFKFISQNWTQESFGSSYAISKGTYRTEIIKNRVIVLLYYLQNYG